MAFQSQNLLALFGDNFRLVMVSSMLNKGSILERDFPEDQLLSDPDLIAWQVQSTCWDIFETL